MNKFKTLLIWVILPLVSLVFIMEIKGSNSDSIKIQDCTKGSVETIKELNKMVKNNFLDREFYEVYTFSDLGPCYSANYNKKHELLCVATDPTSGWSGLYKASAQLLQEIVDKKLNDDEIRNYLEVFTNENYPDDLD